VAESRPAVGPARPVKCRAQRMGLGKGDLSCPGGPGPPPRARDVARASPSPDGRSAPPTRGCLEAGSREPAAGKRLRRFHIYVEHSTSCGRGYLAVSTLIKLIQINSLSGTAFAVPTDHAHWVSPPSAPFGRALTTSEISSTFSARARRQTPSGVCLSRHFNYHI